MVRQGCMSGAKVVVRKQDEVERSAVHAACNVLAMGVHFRPLVNLVVRIS